MVLISLIIIAVVLMALLVLLVSGIRWKPPGAQCQPQGRTGQRPDTGVVTSVTAFSSRDLEPPTSSRWPGLTMTARHQP